MEIRVLFLAANPNDQGRLALGREFDDIRDKVRAADYRDQLHFEAKLAVRPGDLQQALLEYKPHIVHFSGHGRAGEILLLDENGRATPVGKDALAQTFAVLKDEIRVVVLNACYSEMQSRAICEHIDFVIGMSNAITDEAARSFTSSFYRALAFGRSMQTAFDLAKNRLQLHGIGEDHIPRLMVRNGVKADSTFLVAPAANSAEHAESTSTGGSPASPRHIDCEAQARPGGGDPPAERTCQYASRHRSRQRRIVPWIAIKVMLSSFVERKPAARKLSQWENQPQPGRRWGRVLVWALAVPLLAGLAALLWWPPVAIAPIRDSSGGVVVAVRALVSSQARDLHRALCRQLQSTAAQSVRCITLPLIGSSDSRVRKAAAEAGASLVVTVVRNQSIQIQPATSVQIPLWEEMPVIDIADHEVRRQAAPVLHVMRRTLAGDLNADQLRDVSIDPDVVGWRLATLAWYLAVVSGRADDVPAESIRGVMLRCQQDAKVTIADGHCALAAYTYALACPYGLDTRRHLSLLAADGPASFTDLARIAMAYTDCTRDSDQAIDQAVAALARIDRRWPGDDCRRVAVLVSATCLLTRKHNAAADTLQSLAYPELDTFAHCGDRMRSDALAGRGYWNMRAGNWAQAEQDYQQAWSLGEDSTNLVNWAEAMLHQRPHRNDVATRVAKHLNIDLVGKTYRVLAAYLRWVATHAADDAHLLDSNYAQAATDYTELQDPDKTLQHAVCGANRESVECQVYRLLQKPWRQDNHEELRMLLRVSDR